MPTATDFAQALALDRTLDTYAPDGLPTGREPYGNGASVVVCDGESPLHGEGKQVVPTDQNGVGARDA